MIANNSDFPDDSDVSRFSIGEFVDARQLRCPLPLLKAKQALHRVQVGESVEVLATDSGSVRDFHEYARLAGQIIGHFSENHGVYRYIITKNVESAR